MKKIFVFLVVLLHSYSMFAQENLADAMNRLQTETILVVNSQELDDFPIWSPNGDAIAYNINNKWYKVSLEDLVCKSVKWRGQMIGYAQPSDQVPELTESEVAQYKKASNFNAREVTTKNGTKISLPMNDMRTSLVIKAKNAPEKVLWTSGGENCHSLVLSPNEKYVAYLCELNGLLIMRIP